VPGVPAEYWMATGMSVNPTSITTMPVTSGGKNRSTSSKA
jgi:hypothetical protein